MKAHKVNKYFYNPTHNITVNLIGCGGTGSRVLTGLAMINKARNELNLTPIDVTVFDDDKVTEANLGRQMFAPADVGEYKANVLVARINRFYGFEWDCVYEKYGSKLYNSIDPTERHEMFANITITCVDSITARQDISGMLDLHVGLKRNDKQRSIEPYNVPHYLIDAGNTFDHGQVVIQSLKDTKENFIEGSWWKDYQEEFPDEPSCSMAESLKKQHLFINTIMADFTCLLLWDIISKREIKIVGAFVNLTDYKVMPLKFK